MNKFYKKESKIIIDEYQNVENMTILDIEIFEEICQEYEKNQRKKKWWKNCSIERVEEKVP